MKAERKTWIFKIIDFLQVEKSLRVDHNTKPCMKWIDEHRSKLKRMNSKLEINMRTQVGELSFKNWRTKIIKKKSLVFSKSSFKNIVDFQEVIELVREGKCMKAIEYIRTQIPSNQKSDFPDEIQTVTSAFFKGKS